MLIENPDAFKTWLTSILEPLCDADPAALAKYVYALVKKDKSLDDLREGMIDQLDVFLQQDTKPFVDMLFKALDTCEYLKVVVENKSSSPTPEAVEPAKEPEPVPEHAASNGVPEDRPLDPVGNASSRSPPTTGAPRHRVVVSRQQPAKVGTTAPRVPPVEHTMTKLVPLTTLLEEPVDVPKRRDRRGDALRDKDDRRRRRSRSWGRRVRRHGWRELSPHQNNERRYEKRRPTSRSPSPRGRYRNRSPPGTAVNDRPLSRSRSRSPIPLRDHERERDRLRIPREMERDKMSRDREHRERVSRSRDRERERERSRSRSAGTPTADSHHDLPPAQNHFKRRCRDFDERGFCVRGDFCQWDHGTDPLVLDQSTLPPNLSQVLEMGPSVPEYNPLAPDIWSGGYHAYQALPPPRELVPIPRVRELPPPMTAAMPPIMHPTGPPPRHPAPNNKKVFDYNRLGSMRPPLGPNAANCTLELKKVPRTVNNITHLNNHFTKFGKIVNIQVCFEGDPEAALITFSNHTEASVAYKSTEAVLNNRFIKVFWYNPESKQENVPPGGAPSVHKQPDRLAGHTGSHHKVLINKDNMKATAENRVAEEKAKEELKKATEAKAAEKKVPTCAERYSRAHTLLQTQIQQQRLLIERLESGNVTTEAQKNEVMAAINFCQEGIEKLQKELSAYNKAMQAAKAENVSRSLGHLQLSQARKPRTREEAQREILDTELDIFTKQQEGQDVTDLLKKVGELRRQLAIQFPSHSAARRVHTRGARFNPSTRFTRVAPAAKSHFINQSVDHRPRALLISGFEADEIDAVVKHFAQFGEIVGKEVNTAVPELTLQYRVRAHAELALVRAKHYNDRTLSITWVTTNKPITPVVPTDYQDQGERPEPTELSELPAGEQNGGDMEVASLKAEEPEVATPITDDTLLRFDEEEEDDPEEDRSWRR